MALCRQRHVRAEHLAATTPMPWKRCSHEHLVLVATFIDHARLTRGWLQLLTSEPIPDIETTAAEQAAAT